MPRYQVLVARYTLGRELASVSQHKLTTFFVAYLDREWILERVYDTSVALWPVRDAELHSVRGYPKISQ